MRLSDEHDIAVGALRQSGMIAAMGDLEFHAFLFAALEDSFAEKTPIQQAQAVNDAMDRLMNVTEGVRLEVLGEIARHYIEHGNELLDMHSRYRTLKRVACPYGDRALLP